MTKIGVIGAGAIGCYVGGRLVSVGRDLVLIGRPRIRDEIVAAGLTLSAVGKNDVPVVVEASKLRVSTSADALQDCDLVLVSVKSAQSHEAGDEIARFARPDAVVVSMQNGVRNAEMLRERVGGRTVLGGIVGFNVVSKGGGVFRRATSGPLVIEKGRDPRIEALGDSLREAGFEVELPVDPRPQQWSKLVMNLNNAVSALTDVPTPRLVFEKPYARILGAVMSEAIRVIRAAGMPLAKLGPMPVTLFPWLLRLPGPLLEVLARLQIEIDAEARSSMWEDLTRRRPTEVDYLNGEIVRLAEESGSWAPVNGRVVELIHQAEQSGAGSPRMSADDLWQAIDSR